MNQADHRLFKILRCAYRKLIGFIGQEYTNRNIIKGKAIDGYISGAEIFIDQNFNFQKDDQEYSATTQNDGSFSIEVDSLDLYQCLIDRPIIADVPIGAIDSTSGTVIEPYQMILPPISNLGSFSVVISPFTSLL